MNEVAATVVKKTRGELVKEDITALLKARNTLLWVVTREERRVERILIEAAGAAKYTARIWDCATGQYDEKGVRTGAGDSERDPDVMIRKIRDKGIPARTIVIMRDLHKWIFAPTTLRLLCSTAGELQDREPKDACAIIILSPSAEVPPELAGHAVVIDFPIPDRVEVSRILDTVLTSVPEEKREKALVPENREAAIDAAVGLTSIEAGNCYAKSLVSRKMVIDPATVAGEKKRIIAREKVLTWYDPDPRGLEAIGGLNVLKEWLVTRKAAFSTEARAYGIPAPKGLFFCGLPGSGKSLTAKCVATAWNMPLLRLDMGALKGKYVGESEANIRKALAVAETVSPCCLWIDEIDKALKGASGSDGDGGVSADQLGTILTWMQEKTASTFVFVTANEIEGLPPELLRKGRFDEVFWSDLPTTKERAEILKIAIKQSGRKPEGIDHEKVARVCKDFVAAEVAAIVPDAMFIAFADGGREITTRDLEAVALRCTPLATTAATKLDKLRAWAKGKARLASDAIEENGKAERAIDFDADVS